MLFFPKQTPNFEAALRDVYAQSPEWRALAARALGSAIPGQREKAIQGLRTLIGDAHLKVKVAAIEAATALEAPELGAEIKAYVSSEQNLLRASAWSYVLAVLRADALDLFRASVTSADAETRMMAIEGLGAYAPEEVLAHAERFARDKESDVRAELAQTFEWLRREHAGVDASSARLLAPLLKDPDTNVRQEAALAFPARHPDAVAELIAMVQDRWLAAEAARRLGELKIEEAREVLRAKMKSWAAPRRLRLACAAALTRLGVVEGRAYFVDALRSFVRARRLLAIELIISMDLTEFVPDLEQLRPRIGSRVVDEAMERLNENRSKLHGTKSGAVR